MAGGGMRRRCGVAAVGVVVLFAGCGDGGDDAELVAQLEEANRRIEDLESQTTATTRSTTTTSSTTTTTTTTITTAPPPPSPPVEQQPVYAEPDPATVRQFVRAHFAERLERAPDDGELEHSVNWYLAEDRKGGDTPARYKEWFEQAYAGEIRAVERRRQQEQCEEDYVRRYGEPPPNYMC